MLLRHPKRVYYSAPECHVNRNFTKIWLARRRRRGPAEARLENGSEGPYNALMPPGGTGRANSATTLRPGAAALTMPSTPVCPAITGREPPPESRRRVLPAVAIVAVTLLAYLPAMRGGFFWDDEIFLTHNKLIASAGRASPVLADDAGAGLLPAHLQRALGGMAALGKPCRRLPRRQRAASRVARGAALAGAAAAAHSRRVAGGAALRRSPGGRGLRRVDHAS